MGRKVALRQGTETLLELLWKIEEGYVPSEEEKAYLEDITEMDFIWKVIEQLPESLGKCKNLQSLYLIGTQITKLPESLGECKKLQSLYLAFTQITELPEWM